MEMKDSGCGCCCCCFGGSCRSSSNVFLKQFLFFCFFTLLLVSAFQASEAFSSNGNGVHHDLQQLLTFKASLLNSSSLLHDWSPTSNPCYFSGVSCKNSRVSSIDLTNVTLSVDFDSVSNSLITLQYLESLVLKNTNLTGIVTSIERSQCGTLLNSLDLAQNSLSGPVSDILSFSVCSNIFSLNLSSNSMDPPVKDTKFSKSGLQVLDLSHNNISGPEALPWLLSSQFSELKYLSVKGNKLGGEIPLLDLKNLTYLDLSMNNFSTGFPSFLDCSNLEHLDLSSNKFSNGDGEVSASLSSCAKLSFINLTHNQLTGAVPNLGSKRLKFLYLKENDFHGEIPVHLSNLCPSLVVLDLSSNNLSGTVPESLAACTSLEILDISRNELSSELPMNVVYKMNNLKNLILGFNNFSGNLPESLSNLLSLETFDVSSNYISGLIPTGICKNSINNFRVLYLQNNLLTGTVPESLSNCTELVSLDLSFNYLSGRIPSSFGLLSKLRDLIAWSNQLSGEIPEELTYLQSLENLILDFNDLNGSIPATLSNCTNLNWISLSNNLFTGQIPASFGGLAKLAILKLGNNSLSGSIPPELGDCRSLLWLDLNTNSLTGAIPSALFKQSGNIPASFLTGKWYMYIKNDGSKECHGAGNLLEFGGIREGQLDRISTRHPCNFSRVYRGITQPTFNHNGSMIFLDLSYNMLDGSIPLELGSLYYLFVLNLGHNDLSGPIPQELDGLKNLAILDLSYNRLNESIPSSLTGLRLGEIDLSNNKLSGRIPESNPFDTFPENKFVNNSGLCGNPLPPCGTVLGSGGNQHMKSHRGRLATLAGSVAMGLLFSLLFIFSLIVVAIEMKKREKKETASDTYVDSYSLSATANSTWKFSARDLTTNLSTFEKPLMNLTFADLLEATNNFHNDSLIGSGGFGDVYRANLMDGSVVAIKKLIRVSGQGDREFTAEMDTIGRIKHRNLVPLLGYCKVGEERLLVYEYMKYGSLEDVLHDRKKIGIKLNWSARRRIAIGAARGLAFLHHNCIPHIIHRDMKSSNVLLDEKLEARVSDFGMARLMNAMDTHLSVSTLAGTPGYVPPEYYQSFRCTTKGDVYSYGVVLLELLTGKQPTDSADFGDNNNLVGWVKQHTKMKISDILDQEMLKEDDPSLELELVQHLKVACSCLDDRPWKRPTMIQVLAMFKEIRAAGDGSGMDTTTTTTASTTMAAEDGNLSPVESGIEMSITEGNEGSSIKHL